MAERTLCTWEVRSVVKSTFIEFKPIDGDVRPVLRRIKSAPSLLNVERAVIKCMETDSLTISACVSSELVCDSASKQSSPQDRVANWADCDPSELEAEDLG